MKDTQLKILGWIVAIWSGLGVLYGIDTSDFGGMVYLAVIMWLSIRVIVKTK